MLDRNFRCQINEQILKRFSEKVFVYLSKTNTKGSNFDPYHNTGYVTTNSNPIIVKCIVRHLNPENRSLKEIGINENGAIECIVKEKDVSLFKNANKIEYNNNEYSVYHDNLGSRVQIRKNQIGFYQVILFRKGA